MKHLTLSFIGLVSLSLGTLTSCSREEGQSLIIDKPAVTTNQSEGYLRLSVSRPNDVTLRSLTSEPMNEISTLLLLFYNAETQALQSIKELSISSPDQLNNIVVKLEAKDYKLVALANPTTKLRELINIDSPLSNLNTGQSLVADDLIGSTPLSIAMTNHQGAIDVARTHFSNDNSALSSALTIQLEPSLARVLVYGTPSLRAGAVGEAPAKYLVTNIQKQTYVLRQLNKLSSGENEVAGDNSNRDQRYAKSPYWDTWLTNAPRTSEDVGAYPSERSSAEAMSNLVRSTADDFNAELKTNTRLYVKESVLPENSYLQALTPCVVIAYPYIPQGLSLTTNEGFVSYQGRYYKESAVKEMIRNNDRIQAPELMQAIQQNHITQESFNEKQGFDKGGVKFFYKGYSYYSVFIKHFGNRDARYGFYGLVRGNEYHIRLMKINDPGSPTPLVYTNNMNPISEDQSSALKVQVSSLSTRNQEVEL